MINKVLIIGTKGSVPEINQIFKDGTMYRPVECRSLENVKEFLLDDEPGIAEKALISLGGMQSKEAVEKISGLINKSKDEHLIVRAIESLGKIKDKKSVNRLVECIKQGSYIVRYSARKSLAEIGPDAVDSLISLLGYGNVKNKLDAIDVLGEIKDDKAYKHIEKFIDNNDYRLRGYALRALSKFDNPDFTKLLDRMEKKENNQFVKSIIYSVKE